MSPVPRDGWAVQVGGATRYVYPRESGYLLEQISCDFSATLMGREVCVLGWKEGFYRVAVNAIYTLANPIDVQILPSAEEFMEF